MAQATHLPKKCEDCPAEFVPARLGLTRFCPECRARRRRESRGRSHEKERIARGPAPTSRPCRGCGRLMSRDGRVYAWYCSDDCKPRCSADECERPKRKNGLCASHANQLRGTGGVRPFLWTWDEPQDCLVCGKPADADSEHRKFCSGACRVYWKACNGKPPQSARCIHCGDAIPLVRAEGKRYRKRRDVRTCRRCKVDLAKHGTSVRQLALRDGPNCQLCGLAVDMSLKAPDPGCPSVDHKIPRACGGTNDPDNLQLAHLRCNILKHDRIDGVRPEMLPA